MNDPKRNCQFNRDRGGEEAGQQTEDDTDRADRLVDVHHVGERGGRCQSNPTEIACKRGDAVGDFAPTVHEHDGSDRDADHRIPEIGHCRVKSGKPGKD